MKMIVMIAGSLMCALSGLTQGLRSAGTLLVDVSADGITANDGDAVAQWANSGSLGGAFAAITNNAGVSFTNNILGKKAVLFTGTALNALTNTVATPSSLTGSSAWSMEAWVWAASISAPKSVYLAWTEDMVANNSSDGSRVMFRYDTGSVAADNFGSTVGFSYGTPAAGTWHHIAVVRNTYKQEKVFVDGNAVTFSWCAAGVQAGIPLALGAVKRLNMEAYTNFFSGALSRVRIHSGILSDQDVLHNYLADALSYNAATSTVWTGGSGNWNDSANWSNGVVGTSSKAVRILSGTVTVTNNVSPGILSSLDLVGATVSFADANAKIETKTPLVVGRSTGNAGTLAVSLGTLVVNAAVGPAVLSLGMDGASSSLAIGGATGAVSVSASQVRAFSEAGSADVQVMSNGVLELDAFVAEAASNAPSITVNGGTLRSKTGYSSFGLFYNVPQARVSTGGALFDSISGSTQAVSTALIHDSAGASKDGGLRKTSNGVLILSGTNSYNGDTSVEAGTLSLASRLTDGLVYRLDASSNALSTLQFADGSNVVSWADANGSGFLFTTNKAEKCPVYDASLFGGRGGLRFSRDATCYRLTADRSCRAQSVFLVFSPAANNDLGGIWGKSEADFGIRLQAFAMQLCGNANDFASSGWNYINGTAGTAFTVGQPLVATTIADSPQTWYTAIGDYWASTQYRRPFKGDIAEVLVYDRKLDDLERQAVERYLMAKWLGTVSAPQFGASALPTNTVLNVRNGAAVDLGGTSVQLASLNGAGNVVNRNPAITSALTVGGLDADSVFTGTITGNVAVTKVGNGVVTLLGTNSFTGPLVVGAGVLRFAYSIAGVTGLVYRLDASQTNSLTLLADGTNVSSWADAAGSGFSFAVTDSSQCPVYDRMLFNGRGGLRFGLGSRRRMVGSAVTNAQTVFAVNMLRDDSNDNGGFLGKNEDDFGLRIGKTSWFMPGNINDFHYVTNGGLVAINGVVSNSTATIGQPHLVTSVSGSQQSFKPAIGDYWNSSTYPTRYYRGEVAEILVYDRRLTGSERQLVEAALMNKWFQAMPPALPQTAAVTVSAGATLDLLANSVTITSLAGGGLVTNGTLTVTGTVAPTGTLTVAGSPTLTGTLVVNVSANGACDRLTVLGALNLSSLALAPNLPATRPSVTSYTLVTASGGVAGTFKSASLTNPWKLIYSATSVRLVYFSGTVIEIR